MTSGGGSGGSGGVSLTGEGTTVYSGSTTSIGNTSYFTCIAKFIAPVTGVYKITLSNNGSCPGNFYQVIDAILSGVIQSGSYEYLGGIFINSDQSYEASSINSNCNAIINNMNISWNNYNEVGRFKLSTAPYQLMKYLGQVSASQTATFTFHCTAGDFVQIIGSTLVSKYGSLSSVKITCQM